jgi:hypothetical protein
MSAVIQAQQIGLSQLERMAIAIAKSGMFAVKTPEGALTLLLIAQAEGIPPAQAMMDYDLISGKPALKSAAMLARFQRSGGKVQWITSTDDCVEGQFSHPSGGELTVRWDNARVKTAGLSDRDLHKKFPLQMKRARCISEAVRAIAPQCIPVGMYAVEEARDIPEVVDTTIVSETTAVAEAVQQVTHELPRDRVDMLIDSMDVKTLAELKDAFAAAWQETSQDKAAQKRIKAVYDDMKRQLESEASV